MYEPQSAPLSIAGVLDQGFKLLKASFGRVIGLSLFSAFASSLPSAMLQFAVDPQNPSNTMIQIATILVLAGALISLPVYGAIICQLSAVTKNETLSIMGSLGIGVRRLIPFLLCGLMYALACAGGFVLLIVPGIILSLSLIFSVYLVFTDGLGPIASLKESHRLVWGNWWRTATVATVAILITFAAYMLPVLIAGLVSIPTGGEGAFWVLQAFLLPIVSGVVSPVAYALFMAQLQDLKLRKSGDDLSDRLDAVAV
ncbi:MAG: hypothetical protein AAFY29_04215 [Pseudomonadota bacterium]